MYPKSRPVTVELQVLLDRRDELNIQLSLAYDQHPADEGRIAELHKGISDTESQIRVQSRL